MQILAKLAFPILAALMLSACEKPAATSNDSTDTDNHAEDHDHADGAHDDDHDHADDDHDHAHDETALDHAEIDEGRIEFAQGHGTVEPAKESHLVVKLPYTDLGATIVRAWIGTEDRTLSYVGKGTYAPDHDDYDIHAIAPDPLPNNPMWWVEIEKPDGSKVLVSTAPILE